MQLVDRSRIRGVPTVGKIAGLGAKRIGKLKVGCREGKRVKRRDDGHRKICGSCLVSGLNPEAVLEVESGEHVKNEIFLQLHFYVFIIIVIY